MKYVVFSFIAFALFIGALVFVCVKQDVSLVSANYYEEDLRYNQRMEQKKNAKGLATQPQLTISGNQLTFKFDRMNEVQSGSLKLTRPSDQHLDQTFEMEKTTNPEQTFTLSNPQKGLYRLNAFWKMDNKEYFVEQLIVL